MYGDENSKDPNYTHKILGDRECCSKTYIITLGIVSLVASDIQELAKLVEWKCILFENVHTTAIIILINYFRFFRLQLWVLTGTCWMYKELYSI
jgi:hypothetical protein